MATVQHETPAPSTPHALRLVVEVEGRGAVPVPGNGATLIAFMSFCVVRGFGAVHPFLALADLLAEDHRVRLGPLTVFYDGTVDDAEDAEKLDAAWQEAGPLHDTLAAVVAVLASEPTAQALARRAGANDLAEQAASVRDITATAAGARVRLSYRP
jgi:hypothetical protein